ncbi:hypothetical protein BGX34_003050 [Mortierella sp. NVP85]|nr:hypothetical protein BGX34_003050 [Mortierella sp. NVP85]
MQTVVLHQVLLVLLALIIGHFGLVDAQKRPLFRRFSLDPQDTSPETDLRHHVLEAFMGLSSSDSQALDGDKNTKRLSKRKGTGDLSSDHVPPNSPSSTNDDPDLGVQVESGSEAEAWTESKIGHGYDITHEFDHHNNVAYDDIVWYDGPHRDDEDVHEHEREHEDEDEQEDEQEHEHEHDHEHTFIIQDEEGNYEIIQEDHHHHDHGEDHVDMVMQVLDDGSQFVMYPGEMATDDSPDDDSDAISGDELGHPLVSHGGSGPILSRTITTKDFCQRLKHECESSCREFRAAVEHLSLSCNAGSIAELLFWGRCCQIGQEHRVHTYPS